MFIVFEHPKPRVKRRLPLAPSSKCVLFADSKDFYKFSFPPLRKTDTPLQERFSIICEYGFANVRLLFFGQVLPYGARRDSRSEGSIRRAQAEGRQPRWALSYRLLSQFNAIGHAQSAKPNHFPSFSALLFAIFFCFSELLDMLHRFRLPFGSIFHILYFFWHRFHFDFVLIVHDCLHAQNHVLYG